MIIIIIVLVLVFFHYYWIDKLNNMGPKIYHRTSNSDRPAHNEEIDEHINKITGSPGLYKMLISEIH